jgi:hypothetical protein
MKTIYIKLTWIYFYIPGHIIILIIGIEKDFQTVMDIDSKLQYQFDLILLRYKQRTGINI